MASLASRLAIVTGAGSGIGRATAIKLSEAGLVTCHGLSCLSCLDLSCLVLSCLVLSCLGLAWLGLAWLVSCRVLSLVLSCLVSVSSLVLCFLVLSCDCL